MSSLEARLQGIDRRARSTRASFHRALVDGTVPVKTDGLPSLPWLLAAADSPESTFRKHFGVVDKYPQLQPCAGRSFSGVERLVMEVKTLTADPMLRGYRETTARLPAPSPVRLAALTRVLVTWALEYRALARMLADELPDSVEAAVRDLAGSGPRAASTTAEVRLLLREAVAASAGLLPDAVPDEVMSELRGRIAAILPVEDDLLRASRELASHVGAFMLLSDGSRGEVDPELRFVLERAIRVLRLSEPQESTW